MPSMYKNQTVWPLDPHTQAKHVILRRYLGAWFPILNRFNGRIVYIDGFAGPGEYQEGEPGSPLIALDVSANHRRQMDGELVFFFVEADEDKYKHLESCVARVNLPQRFRVHTVHGKFHEILKNVLNDLERRGNTLAPTFAFIDPFGFSGVPMELIHRLLRHGKTEVFINFQSSYINRFLEHPNPQIAAHMIELFGTDEVLKVASLENSRIDNLRSLYQRQLGQAARFVRFFSMRNSRNQPIYDLFFAGNNSLGHYRMKEAMWKADPEGSFTFSDATNPLQTVLFTIDPASALLDTICRQFSGQSRVRTDNILSWIADATPFLETHMKAALRAGEAQNRFSVDPTKVDGKKRQKGTFPSGVIIDFPTM